MSDIVFIKNLKIDAIIGIYDHERQKKQPIILTIEMEWDNKRGAYQDDFTKVLDYEAISNDIKQFVSTSTFQLVETLAEEIAKRIILTFHTPSVMIELHKPNAISDTDSVGVRIFRKQANYKNLKV